MVSSTPPLGGRAVSVAAAVVAVITIATFLPVLQDGFVNMDDDMYVYENPLIHSLSLHGIGWFLSHRYFNAFIPLTLLSHAIDYRFWGLAPFGHHLTSLLLHGLNAALVFILCLFLVRCRPIDDQARTAWQGDRTISGRADLLLGPVIGSLLFALHPLRAESVAWVADRKDLLCALFAIPATVAYMRYAEHRGRTRWVRWYIASLAAFALSLLAKSAVLTLPLLFFAIDGMMKRGTHWKRMLAEKLPFLFLSILAGVLAVASAPSGEVNYSVVHLSLAERILLPIYSTGFYLWKMLWPVALGPVYDVPSTTLLVGLSCAVVVVTLALLLLAVRRTAVPLLAWLGYIVLLLPTLVGISSGIQPWGDRYTYLPMIPLCVVAGSGFRLLLRFSPASASELWRRRALIVGGMLLLMGFSMLSMRQARLWKDSDTLWMHAADVAPHNPSPPNGLGIACGSRRDYIRAVEYYRRAVELEPRFAEGYFNMGIAYESNREFGNAAASYANAVAVNSRYVNAYINWGSLFVNGRKVAEALALYDRALLVDPASADAHYHRGYALYLWGRYDEALLAFEETLRYNPYHAAALNNIGIILFGRGDQDGARQAWEQAVAVTPDNAEGFYNLGVLASARNDEDGAIVAFDRALKLKPDYVAAEMNLGIVYVGLGRIDEGIRHYQHALAVDSSYAPLYYNLGVAYYNRGDRQRSLSMFQKETLLDSSNAEAYFSIGTIHADIGREAEARVAFIHAARLGSAKAQSLLRQQGIRW
jgi:tetratricopeptide (TPR) repeat protein